ncbi:Haloacid dehalogenase-like hydrolase (HAD) superfamily protein [Euphorbia peplus]|nr:Haloacid dehalogenase-like hydrolase (HAD) superfamily protein [Euphorbia peplus]
MEKNGEVFGEIKERKKKLLVLDLNGLLCYRACAHKIETIPKYRVADAVHGNILVYKRPHCEDFLNFCFERFEVAIWSSAKTWYLDRALDLVMGSLKDKLLFSWDQSKCTKPGFNTKENIDKPIFLKELSKIWLNYLEYSSSNTLLIDNDPYKAILNPPQTAVFLNEYDAEDQDDDALGPEGELRNYLEALAKAEEVGEYVKKNPFGKSAITNNDPDWAYYSMVINSLNRGSSTNANLITV